MSRKKFSFRLHFNWRIMFLRILANGIALALTAISVPQIYFVNRTLVDLLVIAIALGILNALIKPIIQFLTFNFIFATDGLVIILINALFL